MDNLDFLANRGNSFGVMFKAGNEYYFEINMKNDDRFQMHTVNGKRLIYSTRYDRKIGKIIKEGNTYKFMNVKGTDVIVEVEADGFEEN